MFNEGFEVPVESAHLAGMTMPQVYDKELELIQSSCRDIESSRRLTEAQKAKLAEQFGDRFKNALELVAKRRVSRYHFTPSGRTIWTVKGRKGVYQVIPGTNFCNCDDYYFRVMYGKKALCYHIIAQKISSALGKFETSDLRDRQYSRITQRWRTKTRA
jgi:predicted nucleic acid-binding Zn finger protein